MPITTPMPQAQWIDWAPAVNGVSTVCATTPTPKTIRVKVPRNSDDISPSSPLRLNGFPSLTGPARARPAEPDFDQWSTLPTIGSELMNPAAQAVKRRSSLVLTPLGRLLASPDRQLALPADDQPRNPRGVGRSPTRSDGAPIGGHAM